MKAIKNAVFLCSSIFFTCAAKSLELSAYESSLATIYEPGELFTIGLVLLQSGLYQEAISYLRPAALLEPQKINYQWTLGDAFLFLEQIPLGMHQFAYRWKYDQLYISNLWNGEPVTNKRILIHHQWDMRNTLLCLRYFRLLKESGATIVLRVPEIQKKLFQQCPYIDEIINTTNDPLPAFDFIVPMMHLPTVFGTTIERIPNTEGLLGKTTDTSIIGIILTQEHSAKFFEGANLNNKKNYFRRVSLPERKTIVWSHKDIPLINIQNYEDLLKIMKQTAFIITDDTITAQLAGILAIPVLLLLNHEHDWFWHSIRTDSPWFQSVHILRTKEKKAELINYAVKQSCEQAEQFITYSLKKDTLHG